MSVWTDCLVEGQRNARARLFQCRLPCWARSDDVDAATKLFRVHA